MAWLRALSVVVCSLAVTARAQVESCAAPEGPVRITPTFEPSGIRWHDFGLTVAILIVAVAGVAFVRWNERRRVGFGLKQGPVETAPYWAGAALGLVIAASLTVFAQPVGASGALQNLAGLIGKRLTPGVAYWESGIPTGATWQVWVVAGVVLGAMLGSLRHGPWRLRVELGDTWRAAFGPSRTLRFGLAFAGAALIEFASAIAGGCTSGLALSGGIVLSPGAFLFMAAMFATGIPTALLVARAGRRRSAP